MIDSRAVSSYFPAKWSKKRPNSNRIKIKNSNKITKPNLLNIIKAILIQQKWADKVEGEIENSNTEESGETDETDEHENGIGEVKNEDDKDLNDKVCHFFRTKTCKHGKSGKVPD